MSASAEQQNCLHTSSHFQTEDNTWCQDPPHFHPPLALRRPPGCMYASPLGVDAFNQACPIPLTPPSDQSTMHSDNLAKKSREVTCYWPSSMLIDSAYSSPSAAFMDPVPVKKSMVQRYLESLPEEVDDAAETPQMGPIQIQSPPTEMMLDMPYRDFHSIFEPEVVMTDPFISRPYTPYTPTGTPKPLTEAALSNFGICDLSLSSASRASTPGLSRSLSRSSYRIPRQRSSKARKSIQDDMESSDCATPTSFVSNSTLGCSRVSSVRKPPPSPAKETKTRIRLGRSRTKKTCTELGPTLQHPIPTRGGHVDTSSGTDLGSSEEDSCFSETELSAFEYKDDAPGVKEFIKSLLEAFDGWQRQRGGTKRSYGQANGPGDSSGLPSGLSSNLSQQEFFNGQQSQDQGGADANDEDGAETQQASKKRKALSRPNRTFACPFWKKDARKHRACGKLTLTRVKDVKQHLNRSRAHKPHYCSCCYETFPTREALDEHSRARSCPLRSPRLVEGLTEQQSRLLQRRVDRRLSDEEQWYCMWDIIFPGIPRPLSPYVDHDLSEDLAEFREFTASDEAAGIFQEYLASHGYQFTAPRAGRERTNAIISGGFDIVYNRWLEVGREQDGEGEAMGRTLSNNPLISPPESNSSQGSPEATRRMVTDMMEPEAEAEGGAEGQAEAPSGSIITGLFGGIPPMSPLHVPGDGFGDESFSEFLQFEANEHYHPS
ncbi:hypothetical protein MKZ38_000210 [Zalerion maritima]|uniref:C2H2-type domain-containing protein n=1 Tax=Zalerion maritima TaxID=339359 RepID=A0AAD5WSN7_9PEZI|nr:hypothetical protein MKZ38_000210 [Zalerion maritima]